MTLASHNSFSYLPPKHWWMRPFRWMARCQDLNIFQQYKQGVRIFDIRVWGFKTSFVDYEVCHGHFSFDVELELALSFLDNLAKNTKEDIWCRIWLEEDKVRSKHKDIDAREQNFINFCYYIQLKFSNIKFIGGKRKFDEKVLFDFGNDVIVIDKYSSTTSYFSKYDGPGNFTTFRYLDDLYPRLYAKKYNKENLKMYENNTWVRDFDINKQSNGGVLMMDFVGKYI